MSLSDADWSVASHNIRTQHSLCWAGVRSDYEVIHGGHLREFCKQYGWRITAKYTAPSVDDFYNAAFGEHGFQMTDDDKIFFTINLNRLRLAPPETGLVYAGEKALAVRMDHDYEHWKSQSAYIDFTGMVEEAITKRRVPTGVRYILVDEAQDLCPLLYEYHKVLYQAFPEAEKRWYGDEDQCIYEFMGADPNIFVSHESHQTVYGEISYRLPASVAGMANEYIKKNKHRFPKTIQGQAKPGEILKCTSWVEAAAAATQGATGPILWLCPTNSQVDKTRDLLREAGYALKQTPEDIQAATTLALIQSKPRRLGLSELRLLTEAKVLGRKLFPYDRHWWAEPQKMSKQLARWLSGEEDLGGTGLGSDDDRLSPQMQEVLQTGRLPLIFDETGDDRLETAERLLKAVVAPYAIDVTSYHKSKGREADVVVVLKDVNGKMLSSLLWDPEAGRRTGFVALTRTRGRLVLYRQEHERYRDWYKVTWN